MNDININEKKLTRVEIIDENGRVYTHHKPNFEISLSVQDKEKTLKVFIKSTYDIKSGDDVKKLYLDNVDGFYRIGKNYKFYCKDSNTLYNFIKLSMGLHNDSPEWENVDFIEIIGGNKEKFNY